MIKKKGKLPNRKNNLKILFKKNEKIKKLKKSIFKKKKTLEVKKNEEYLKMGINGFDKLFEKNYGIPSGAAVLVEGGPGSGKTIFCLSAINGLCKKGKKCLYMSFEEPEEGLIKHMENFGWKPQEYIKKDLLRIRRFDAIDVSRSVEALLSAAKKELLIKIDPVLFPKDYQPDFIVIDSLTSIASAFSGQESRFRVYMEQLFRHLEKKKITNFLIREVSSPSHIGTTFKEQGEAVSFLSDGIVVIYNVIHNNGKREVALEILKMRGSSFKRRIVKMRIIDKKGVFVYPDEILKKTKEKDFELT
ncbi:MAG: ATPase domain-containing protein [archaeon]